MQAPQTRSAPLAALCVRLLGLAILAAAAAGVFLCAGRAAAQWRYFEAKYGTAAGDVRRMLRLCERAHALYPRNYLNCSWAADRAFDLAAGMRPSEARLALESSRQWCERGLELHPHWQALRFRMAEILLAEGNADEAVAWWQAYVDWHFWDAFNHATLARLRVRAGRRDLAEQELKWVEGTPHHAAVVDLLRDPKR